MLFFSEFSSPAEYERNSGLKVFSRFLGLFNPVLARNNARKVFINFFFLFLWNFLAQVEYERNSGLKCFFSFSANIIPLCLKKMPERAFLIFFIFFSEFSCSGRVVTEFGTKFFLSFSAFLGVLAKNNVGNRFFNFFIFFLFFSEFSCPSRVWTEFGTQSFFSLSRLISSSFG